MIPAALELAGLGVLMVTVLVVVAYDIVSVLLGR